MFYTSYSDKMSRQNGNFTLFLTSNASLDVYGSNNSSRFTNVLKETIRLDPNVNFEARLANFHIPNVEYIFKKDDFAGSSLIYNVGLFQYDTEKERYFENKQYTKELFRLAPDRNIEGLFEKSSRKTLFNSLGGGGGGLNDDDAALDPLGKPYTRVKKEKFLATLSRSLRLLPAGDKHTRELVFLNLFKQYLNRSNIYKFGALDNLLINPFLDLNYVQMASFNNLKGKSGNQFFYKLLRWADYAKSTRDYLSGITGLSNPNAASSSSGSSSSTTSSELPRVKRNLKPPPKKL